MINPPLSLFKSVSILDNLVVLGIPKVADNAGTFMDNFFRRLADHYHHQEKKVDITDPDFLFDFYKYHTPKETTLEALIGVSFRSSSSGMIFTADVMTDGGYIISKGAKLTTGTSLTDFFVVANRTSFTDYFYERLIEGVKSGFLIGESKINSVEYLHPAFRKKDLISKSG